MARSASVFALLLITSLASDALLAQENQISFSGAVVEPTCSIKSFDGMPESGAALRQKGPSPMTCSGATAASSDTRFYTASVEDLSASESDRVLRYFYAYTTATRSDAPHPVLLTQTYE